MTIWQKALISYFEFYFKKSQINFHSILKIKKWGNSVFRIIKAKVPSKCVCGIALTICIQANITYHIVKWLGMFQVYYKFHLLFVVRLILALIFLIGGTTGILYYGPPSLLGLPWEIRLSFLFSFLFNLTYSFFCLHKWFLFCLWCILPKFTV